MELVGCGLWTGVSEGVKGGVCVGTLTTWNHSEAETQV